MSNSRNTIKARLRGARGFFLIIAVIAFLVVGIAVAAVMAMVPDLPDLKELTDYKPKIPLRVYTADKVLIGEFGTEHREFVPIQRVPDLMKKALLAIEDTRFYEHGGVDYLRALGAAKANVARGGFRQGGSTITMQVARDFYLTKAKNWTRKFTEIALTYKIESELSKDQILELYMNQIYLGQRSYGFGAAARTYFGKPLDQLSVAETAMLAGLPQNPSRHNPVSNFKRATARQHIVLRRMQELGFITQEQHDKALAEKLVINQSGQEFDTHAEYVAEIGRQAAVDLLKDDAYSQGIVVTTTIRKADQDAAYEAVRRNVIAFDQRHGYRGPEARIDLPADQDERDELIDDALEKRPTSDGLIPAVVTEASPRSVKAETAGGETVEITGDGLKFAASALSANARAAIKITPGAVIRISKDPKKGWAITQVPQVAAAFIAIDADTGAYQAMVGGFDYNLQKYNHVTQAWRQPGSAFKPILFSAALEKAYFPATQILDEQLDMPGESEGDTWSPRNDDGVFDGSVTMRQALAKSKNVPSVRLLRAIDVPYMHDYMAKFGFDTARHPRNYTMALGTGLVTPVQMAGAYAVFANGGYRVTPYLIASIEDDKGTVLMRARPPAPKLEENRAIDERNAFIMDSMMHDVTRYGTGAAAMKQLNRPDIAGKTGTTSDAVDGWFAGYGGNIVAVAWMGYDEPKSLGSREFGATLALPFWIDYMKVALDGKPVRERTPPEGVMQFNGDWIYSEYEVEGYNTTLDMDELPPLEEPGAPAPAADKPNEAPKPAEPAAAAPTTTP